MPTREAVASQMAWGKQPVQVCGFKERRDMGTEVSPEALRLCGKCKEGW